VTGSSYDAALFEAAALDTAKALEVYGKEEACAKRMVASGEARPPF
jgi:hypothetical protein